MMVMINYSLEGTAYGGDYDGQIGALWITCLLNTSEVESAPHCLPASRGYHSSFLTGQDTVCFGY